MSIRKQYDTDLEALKAALVEMGSNSAEAVEAALEAPSRRRSQPTPLRWTLRWTC